MLLRSQARNFSLFRTRALQLVALRNCGIDVAGLIATGALVMHIAVLLAGIVPIARLLSARRLTP